MYLQTSRLQYNLQGVVLLQTAFSKKIYSVFTVHSLYHKYGDIATHPGQQLHHSRQRKGICSAQRMEQQLCDEKMKNAEITVFLCRKLLLFDVECGIMTVSDKMH